MATKTGRARTKEIERIAEEMMLRNHAKAVNAHAERVAAGIRAAAGLPARRAAKAAKQRESAERVLEQVGHPLRRSARGLTTPGVCRRCGCTEEDCRKCIERTGRPCQWADQTRTLCSACAWLEYAYRDPAPQGGKP